MTSLLFPGQGAHEKQMLDDVTNYADFSKYYQMLSEAVGQDVLRIIEEDEMAINRNLISSALTTLVSVIYLTEYRQQQEEEPSFYAGYSIGQWSALYAAGAISLQQLFEVVKARADAMDNAIKDVNGAMLAVIGLFAKDVEAVCAKIRAEGEYLVISNYNCVGQYSLSGTEKAIELATEQLSKLNPKKMLKLPVSGPWHCSLLFEAAETFKNYLQNFELSQPARPVIDNVTGEFLPGDIDRIKEQMGRQICEPVQWEAGIKTLIDSGNRNFIEMGYGNVLTKFGFFIDRSVAHKTYSLKEQLI